jgi:hypothetical protein
MTTDKTALTLALEEAHKKADETGRPMAVFCALATMKGKPGAEYIVRPLVEGEFEQWPVLLAVNPMPPVGDPRRI